jgi:flagellar biosynthesis/type III secretory pathway protein FliH
MTLTFGRVVKAAELGAARELATDGSDDVSTQVYRPQLPRGRSVPRDVVACAEEGAAIIARARAEAERIVQRAEQGVAELRLRAEAEGRAGAVASLAAHSIALKVREAASLNGELDRIVELARILAERLLGASLGLDPERVIDLARRAIAEATGARRVTVIAHPEDASHLEAALGSLPSGAEAVRVVADPKRPRHGLRLETDIGVLDAELAPQLERLALKLRETLGA